MDWKERKARHDERKRQRKLELEEREKAYLKEQQAREEEEERQIAELEQKKHEPHSFMKSFRRVKKYVKESKCLAVWEILDHLEEKTIAISFDRDWSPMWYEFGTYSALEKELGLKRQTAHPILKKMEVDEVIIFRGPKHKRSVAFNPALFDITKEQMKADGIDIDQMEPGKHWRIKITKTETLVWDSRKGKPQKEKRKRGSTKKKRSEKRPGMDARVEPNASDPDFYEIDSCGIEWVDPVKKYLWDIREIRIQDII